MLLVLFFANAGDELKYKPIFRINYIFFTLIAHLKLYYYFINSK